jgi:AcrR family transcriptional regulator
MSRYVNCSGRAGVELRSMAKQAQRREATRSAIIGAATELFGTRGFEATTVDDIAQKAALAKGAVYHHFATKEAIFEVVFENASLELFEKVGEAARRAPDALAAMAVGTRAYFDACSKGPTARIILEDGPTVLGWERWREIDEKYFGGSVVQALTHAIQTGLIEKQPVEPLARLLLGAATEAAVACASKTSRASACRQYAAAYERLIAGLRRQGSSG